MQLGMLETKMDMEKGLCANGQGCSLSWSLVGRDGTSRDAQHEEMEDYSTKAHPHLCYMCHVCVGYRRLLRHMSRGAMSRRARSDLQTIYDREGHTARGSRALAPLEKMKAWADFAMWKAVQATLAWNSCMLEALWVSNLSA